MHIIIIAIIMSVKLLDWNLGRSGNNIIQIIHMLKFAEIKQYRKIIFPKQPLLITTEITIHDESYSAPYSAPYSADITPSPPTSDIVINGDQAFHCFAPLNLPQIITLTIDEYKTLFFKYLLPIFKINILQPTHFLNNEHTLVIHIRGGDIFSGNPHKSYVQPPLEYYI